MAPPVVSENSVLWYSVRPQAQLKLRPSQANTTNESLRSRHRSHDSWDGQRRLIEVAGSASRGRPGSGCRRTRAMRSQPAARIQQHPKTRSANPSAPGLLVEPHDRPDTRKAVKYLLLSASVIQSAFDPPFGRRRFADHERLGGRDLSCVGRYVSSNTESKAHPSACMGRVRAPVVAVEARPVDVRVTGVDSLVA